MERIDSPASQMGMPTQQAAGEVTIKMGKVHFVIKERFPEFGRGIDEILEGLIVEKCNRSA